MSSKQIVEIVDLGIENRGIGNPAHILVKRLIHDAKTIHGHLCMTDLRGDSELGVRASRAVEDEVREGWVNNADHVLVDGRQVNDGAKLVECLPDFLLFNPKK